MWRLALWICALMAPVMSHAQAYVPVSGYRSWSGTNWLVRPLPTGTAPSACTYSYTPLQIGTIKLIAATAEMFIASTEAKGAHVTVGAQTTQLVFPRYYTTAYRDNCGGGGQQTDDCAANAAVSGSCCFTDHVDIATDATCFYTGAASTVRGQYNALNLKSEVEAWNGYAATHRGAAATKPWVMLMARWDTITQYEAQVAGFDESFLIETNPANWTEFQTWLNDDETTLCGGPGVSNCRWSDSLFGSDGNGNHNSDVGIRFRDQLATLTGNADAYKGYAYYMTRPNSTRLYPDGAMTDMADDAYVNWKLARLQAIKNEIDEPNTIILLNSKLNQRFPGPTGVATDHNAYVVDRCPNVSDYISSNLGGLYDDTPDYAVTKPNRQSACHPSHNAGGDTPGAITEEGSYTADLVGAGVDYEDYVLSLKNVADEMTEAGEPYAWSTSGGEFGAGNYYDWASSTGTNENAVLLEIALGAGFIHLATSDAATIAAAEAYIKGKIPYVVAP